MCIQNFWQKNKLCTCNPVFGRNIQLLSDNTGWRFADCGTCPLSRQTASPSYYVTVHVSGFDCFRLCACHCIRKEENFNDLSFEFTPIHCKLRSEQFRIAHMSLYASAILYGVTPLSLALCNLDINKALGQQNIFACTPQRAGNDMWTLCAASRCIPPTDGQLQLSIGQV